MLLPYFAKSLALYYLHVKQAENMKVLTDEKQLLCPSFRSCLPPLLALTVGWYPTYELHL